MKWKTVKFWCWLEMQIPADDPGPYGVQAEEGAQGAQGSQGPQGVQACGYPLVGKSECFDLLTVSTEFELNAIPSCVVNIAIGRRADDVSKASRIHYYIDDLKLQFPVKVWCQAMSPASSDGPTAVVNDWPADKFKIFEGYTTGSGFRRSSTGAEFTLAITHWLADLNYSSAVSKQMHPLNASQYFFPASFTANVNQSGGGSITSGPRPTAAHVALSYFLGTTVSNDFWGGDTAEEANNGLKAWLLSLTFMDRINAEQISNLATGNITDLYPAANWEACRALSRFEPNAITPEVTETGYVQGVPLAMAAEEAGQSQVTSAIATDIGVETLEGYSSVTLWDKLAGQFHSNYMYSIVPLVDKALVVPYVPGLSSGNDLTLVHRILRTSDYESIDSQTTIPRPLRAVGVVMDRAYEAGGSHTLNRGVAYAGFGGWFDKMAPAVDDDLLPVGAQSVPDSRYKEGLIMFKSGAKWMANLVSNWAYTPQSAGVVGTINTGVAIGGTAPTIPAPRELLAAARNIWDLYARTLYIHEVLKNRQGTISGPVRFDIAPGSSLMVEATEDKYVQAILNSDIKPGEDCKTQYYKYFWCSVLRVSTVIDCQNMRGATNLYVAHSRSRDENVDVATAIGRHPLWQNYRWAGASLVNDAAFEPVVTRDPAP